MALTVDHLGIIRAELFDARSKWYDIGLALKVPVTTLDSIYGQFGNHSDKLRETLKVWLKTATEPSWQDIVEVLKQCVVSEPKLAGDIKAKHCTTAETGQASRQTMPEVQQPQLTRGAELQTLQQALQDSREIRIKDQQDSQKRIHTLQQELQTKDQQLQDSMCTLQQELQDSQQQIEELKCQLQQAQQQVEEKQHAIEEKERKVRELTKQLLAMKLPGAEPQKAIQDMTWQPKSKAPEKIVRGSVASDFHTAYFSSSDSTRVYSYDSDTRDWYRLPRTPHTHFTLVMVQHLLTMVGGELLKPSEATDSLLSFMGEGRNKKWLPHFPAMPTKRYNAAVICSGCFLIVAGGEDGDRNSLATVAVEVLDTDTRQWSIASSLTDPFVDASISICGERLYMLGGGDQTGHETHSVLSCSVPELLQSCQPEPLAGKPQTAPANQSTIWQHVADVPHYWSSCATLCGQLVAVGGYRGTQATRAIIGYSEKTDSWEAIGELPTARRWALVVVLNGKMMVVGGQVGGLVWTKTNVVEILC